MTNGRGTRGSLSKLALCLLAVLSAGCGGSQHGRSHLKLAASHTSSHVVVIVMENKEYGDVIGTPAAPYVNRLARTYALATNFYAVGHPSLPNYLALTGGETFGTRSDCTACHFPGRNLVDELESAGISWKAYLESVPAPCRRGATAAGSANPFAYYDSITRARRRCSKIVPYQRLATDLRHLRLPTFIWISPNRCHDTHDCGVRTGDNFLARLVPKLLHRLGPHGVLFLTWDEGRSNRGCCLRASGGHVATIVAGPDARRGSHSNSPYDHFSILRTISEVLGVAPLRQAACPCTKPLDVLFSRRPTL